MYKRIEIRNFLVVLFIIIFLLLGFYFLIASYLDFHVKEKESSFTESKEEDTSFLPPSLQIMDENSKTRPIAVMINNHDVARPYHSGLQDAYLIYEMVAEGGYTRYMALFKDKATERIGSVRSSRHYFLDYVMENDAIYVHWGFSPQAQGDIEKYAISNINGLVYDGKYFFRDYSLGIPLEHTGFTSMSLLQSAINRLHYRNTSTQKTLLSYSTDLVDYSSDSTLLKANSITIPYSSLVTTSYTYDPINKVYNRYVNGEPHTDYVTQKNYTFKNIILYQVSNTTIDGYGRQILDNIGSGNGYYISNGEAVLITWEKKTRESQTVYRLLDGTPLFVNDGNTFIQIAPLTQKYSIE